MSEQLNAQKQSLQVFQIQLETLVGLESVKRFLEIREKAEMLSSIIQSAEAPAEDVQD
jgi:hypothetical protein